MSFETTTPSMNLVLPGVGLTSGPVWATDLNNTILIIDTHDHSSGKGVQVTPAGLNISADLTFQANNATNLRSVRFTPQVSVVGASDLGCLYEQGVDLFYNDGNGAVIRLTQSGGIAGTPGSISGLVSPASAAYVGGSSTFVWQSNANTPANLDAASIILRNLVANSKGLTLSAPAAMANDYSIVLPTLPGAQSFLTLDSFGNMAAPWTVDNSTIKVTANQLVAQAAGLADGVTLQAVGNTIAIRNGYMQHSFKANGPYSKAAFPQTAIDEYLFLPFNATIIAVWIASGTAGVSGITEYDLKVGTSGGSFASLLSTTGKIDSTAASGVWTDNNSVVGVQTGVTKPVLSTTSINAGQALRFDILQTMSKAADAELVVQYIAR